VNERRGTRQIHRQGDPRTGLRELLAGGAQQHCAVSLVAVECHQQSRHILIAGHRELRVQLHAQRLRQCPGGHPFRQGVLGALGGRVHQPLTRRTVAKDALRGDQPGTLQLLQHRIQAFGHNLPGRPQPPIETVGEVIPMARLFQQQAKQRAFQR
jgi:hypothetical protein